MGVKSSSVLISNGCISWRNPLWRVPANSHKNSPSAAVARTAREQSSLFSLSYKARCVALSSFISQQTAWFKQLGWLWTQTPWIESKFHLSERLSELLPYWISSPSKVKPRLPSIAVSWPERATSLAWVISMASWLLSLLLPSSFFSLFSAQQPEWSFENWSLVVFKSLQGLPIPLKVKASLYNGSKFCTVQLLRLLCLYSYYSPSQLVIHSFIKYLLSAYYMPGTVIDTWDTLVKCVCVWETERQTDRLVPWLFHEFPRHVPPSGLKTSCSLCLDCPCRTIHVSYVIFFMFLFNVTF